jgi:hypothetical protein
MMLSKQICLLIFFCFSDTVCAQSKDTILKPSFFYYNQFLTGGAIAEKAHIVTLTASTFHGVRYKSVALGLGLSYDAYTDWKTLPVLISFSYDLTRSVKNRVFVQIDGGSGRLWRIERAEEIYTFEQMGSRLIHPSIGYRMRKEGWSMYLRMGYKFHRLKYDMAPSWWSAPGNMQHVTQDVQRIVFQMGFGVN